jgi:hypothetical protein
MVFTLFSSVVYSLRWGSWSCIIVSPLPPCCQLKQYGWERRRIVRLGWYGYVFEVWLALWVTVVDHVYVYASNTAFMFKAADPLLS